MVKYLENDVIVASSVRQYRRFPAGKLVEAPVEAVDRRRGRTACRTAPTTVERLDILPGRYRREFGRGSSRPATPRCCGGVVGRYEPGRPRRAPDSSLTL